MNERVKNFIKDYRTIILIVFIVVSIASISYYGISQGLDLQGGSLIQVHLEKPVDQDTMNRVTGVLDRRLNIFGVKDIKVRASGNQDVIIEIAGVKPDEVAQIVGTPGKFVAKIDNQTALEGSDIVSVQPYEIQGTQWAVPFKITLEGANKFASIAEGKAGAPVDMYLDDKLISSPELAPELATGRPSTDVQISGTENTKEEAEKQAKSIQTVLQSGALPVKVQIVGISTVSPELGTEFKNGALIAGFLALIVVSLIIFFRYRTPKLVIPIIFTSLAELLLILGVASIIKWNIDLAAIAGIIAAIGTGVDDQIILTDEVLKSSKQEELVQKKESKRSKKKKKSKKSRKSKFKSRVSMSMKNRIKNAFFIIFASAATLIAAMLPVAYVGFSRGSTGIGSLAGFAFTTIIGILIGIFITRPVYAKFLEYFVVD
ncbi:MAG: preprotein translocase subunit SecD [Methanobacteriaceae archaeon]|nr:preprotein translocase subunit SecD [Methanobacteriaceae archaeon]